MILNWNGREMTRRCLESLEKLVFPPPLQITVLVVDNHSNDGSVTLFNKFQFLNPKMKFQLIQNRENLGYAEGNNVGIKSAIEAGADYLCLLNNDVRVDPDFLNELVQTAQSSKTVGIVGGKIYFENGSEFHKERYQRTDLGKVIWYAGGIFDWKNVYGFHRGVDEVDKGQYDRQEKTVFVNGCLMLIKKEVVQKIGLIDSKYFMYLEDTDFCLRAKKAGFELLYEPKAVIWHLNAGSSGVGSDLHDYFITRNRLLFGLRWASLRSKLALIKESFTLISKGRRWQKIGVKDFYLRKFGRGSWPDKGENHEKS